MYIHRHFVKKTQKYKADQSGQIAVWFAILALPILTLTSFVTDYSRAEKVRVQLSAALDDAAIAAVLNQNLTVQERKVFAENYFWQNFGQNENFELNVIDSSAQRVELSARGTVPATIIKAIGKEDIGVYESAVGELTKNDVICVLALDPDGAQSFEVMDGADFQAKDCSVQVNSTHAQAAFVDGSSRASAKSFCTSGGASGTFIPFANTECSVIEDPYTDLEAPASEACINDRRLLIRNTGIHAEQDGLRLYPGTYCGGLTVSGLDVSFTPGEYIMLDGPLKFTKESSAIADRVTFIMRGRNAILDVEKGSELTVTAPRSGKLAGLAFYQDTHSNTKKNPQYPNGRNTLMGGAKMTITGTVYFPTQEVIIGGGSGLGTQAPATSFIGYRVSFGDAAQISIKTDHRSAQLPPLLPRSDEGARLTQ